jgi:mevalonate kinase
MSDIQFVLMDMQADIVSAWKDAFEQQCSKVIRERFTMVKTALSEIGEVGHPKFDCIVSPANSYGRLDGR